ncbi:FMRFamide receptor-like [Plakobranchus ocellatus]|uniref:FMRFamide receptor-like n=1 Tax=Plakobranchus ocellatus TaxID=259542 RepID=A0AAV4AMD7_9GAST|nr:FMRFamide receptor-like [Plakobranchus ocellatus]
MQGGTLLPYFSPTLPTTSGEMTSRLTSSQWPVGSNISTALFAVAATQITSVIPENTTLAGGRRFRTREESGYVVASEFLEKYYSLFLLLFGTLGNVLCFGVLSRKTFRRSTIGIFLRFLTIADLSALWTGVFYFAVKSLFEMNIRKTSELSCKIHFWLSYTSCDLSSWTLVLVSSARLASILRPMSHFITNRRAYAAILMTILLALCANLPIYFMYGDVTDPSKGYTKHCSIKHPSYRYFIIYVWTWIVLIKFALVPGTILLALNVVLIVHVYRSTRIIEDMQRSSIHKGYRNQEKEEENKKIKDGGHSIWECSGCCGAGSESVKSNHLGRKLTNKISFSKWRRKAVVMTKEDDEPDLNTTVVETDQITSLTPMIQKNIIVAPTGGSNSRLTHNSTNGRMGVFVPKPSSQTFQASREPTYLQSSAEVENLRKRFRDGNSRTSLHTIDSPAPVLRYDQNPECKYAPSKTKNFHESYADIKQLRDAYLWSVLKTSKSMDGSTLASCSVPQRVNRKGKFRSCVDILRPESNEVKTRWYNNQCPMYNQNSLAKTGNLLHQENELEASTKSSSEQFHTGSGPDIDPNTLGSLTPSLNASQDFITYDKMSFYNHEDRRGRSNTDTEQQSHLLKDIPSNIYDNQKGTALSRRNNRENYVDRVASCESVSDSSSDEFYSCADNFDSGNKVSNEKGYSLKYKHSRESPKVTKSNPTIITSQFRDNKRPVQIINIPNGEEDAGDTNNLVASLDKGYTNTFLENKEKAKCYHLGDHNVNIADSEFDKVPHTQLSNSLINTSTLSSSFPLVIQSIACDDNCVVGGDVDPGQIQTYGTADSSSNDCLRVITPGNICDINVTRCSSANDNLSLSEHTHDKDHAVPANFRTSDKNPLAVYQPQGSKSDQLCVERRLSTTKRDCAVSLADLNLSLSSLGKNSLASGASDISSFTIAPPSAFTSIENLTTTVNTDTLKKVAGQKKSPEVQKTQSNRTASNRQRGHQKKKKNRTSYSMFPRSAARPKNLTRTLLVINTVFLVCNIPIVIYMTGKTYFFPGGYNDRQNLFNTCANFIMYTNNALNFLLYCLTGTRFRHQLRAMFWDFGEMVRGSIRRPPRRANV